MSADVEHRRIFISAVATLILLLVGGHILAQNSSGVNSQDPRVLPSANGTKAGRNPKSRKKEVVPPPPLPQPPATLAPDPFRIVVPGPTARILLDYDKVYVIQVMKDFNVYIELPERVVGLFGGSRRLYYVDVFETSTGETSNPGQPEVPEGSPADINGDGKSIIIKPSNLIGESGQIVQTNFNIKLESGKMISLLVRSAASEAETIYRCHFRDPQQEAAAEQRRQILEASKLAEKERERERERNRRGVRQFLIDADSIPSLVTSVRSEPVTMRVGDIAIRMTSGRQGQTVGVKVVFERGKNGKPILLQLVKWTLNGRNATPAETIEALPSQIDRSAKGTFLFELDEGSDDLHVEIGLSCSVQSKPASVKMICGKLTPSAPTPPPVTDVKPLLASVTTPPAPTGTESDSIPPEVVKQAEFLLDVTNVRSVPGQVLEKYKVTGGLKTEQVRGFTIVVLVLERRLGKDPLSVSAPVWTVGKKPVEPVRVLRMLPGQLETRPLAAAYIFPTRALTDTPLEAQMRIKESPITLRTPLPSPPQPESSIPVQHETPMVPKPEIASSVQPEPSDMPTTDAAKTDFAPAVYTGKGPLKAAGERSPKQSAASKPTGKAKTPNSLENRLNNFRKEVKTRIPVEGLIFKVFSVVTETGRTEVFGEIVNSASDPAEGFEGVIVESRANTEGFTAYKSVQPGETFLEKSRLEIGDFSRIAWSFPVEVGGRHILELRWRQKGEQRALRVNLVDLLDSR